MDVRDDGGMVLGDSRRLVQVLTNLLNNAAKYTPQRGRITLTATVRDGQAGITVADNGMGMDAALLPHVFELFTQAERTPDRREGGLGLGLALVKSIVALHNGKVSASSAGPGQGSTFTVSLPLLPSSPRQDTSAAPSRAGATAIRPLHILLVDRADDGDAALSAALQAEGHVVALCPDEASALNCALERQPDAVLIRTDLPDVEGYALARQLRALHPGKQATFIALNGSGQSHDKVIARGAGFDHQLERPVALASLKKVLPTAPS
jgi:CheY-like chemotaxis protein